MYKLAAKTHLQETVLWNICENMLHITPPTWQKWNKSCISEIYGNKINSLWWQSSVFPQEGVGKCKIRWLQYMLLHRHYWYRNTNHSIQHLNNTLKPQKTQRRKFHTPRPMQNGRHCTDILFLFFYENCCFFISKFHRDMSLGVKLIISNHWFK